MNRNSSHLRFIHHASAPHGSNFQQQPAMPAPTFDNHALALSPIEGMPPPPQHPPSPSQTSNFMSPSPQQPIQIIQYRCDPPTSSDKDLIVISSDEEDTNSETTMTVRNRGHTIEDAISLVDDDDDANGGNEFTPPISYPATAVTAAAASLASSEETESAEPAMYTASIAVTVPVGRTKLEHSEPVTFATVTKVEQHQVTSEQEHGVEDIKCKHEDEQQDEEQQESAQKEQEQQELKLAGQVLRQQQVQQEIGHEQRDVHEEKMASDLDEFMPDSSDDESISSSELLFGQQAANCVDIDIDLLHALNAPDTDDEDPPDWQDLARLSIVDGETAESRAGSSVLLVETPPSKNTSITTYIPEDSNLRELLSQIEIYKESVHSEVASMAAAEAAHARDNAAHMNSTRLSQKRRKVMVEQTIKRPYVPCRIWSNVTWEDWAQFEVGDWLHWPFEDWEVSLLDQRLKQFGKMAKKRRPSNETPSRDAFEFVAEQLPGRRGIDCKRFWEDRCLGLTGPYNKPVIISKRRERSKKLTPYDVIAHARYRLGSRVSSAKTVLWSNLDCETVFGDGSADCLAVKIITDNKSSGVSVVAGCACNDQPEYNIPGNLRLWSSENEKVRQLRGHRAEVNLPSGAHQMWYTVTDVCVSNDHRFIFSSSHDKTARVWDAQNGKMLSTLVFHEQKIHQMAVSPDLTENIVGTASADGSAVIWRLSGVGNVGSGQVCDLDMRMASNSPQCSIDTLAFGTGHSKNMLFTGVVTGLVSPGGFVQVFDTGTASPVLRFESMRSAVCDLDVSSSGKYIVSGNYSVVEDYSGDGYVHVNDIRQPQSVIKAKTNHPDVNVVRMSPCERYIASGNPTNETAVIDIRRPDRLLYRLCHKQTLAEHLVPINSDTGISGIHWMSNSKFLITGGGDCSVKIWDVWGNGDIVRTYPTSNNVASLAVNEEAMLICAGVSGAQGLVHIFSPSPL